MIVPMFVLQFAMRLLVGPAQFVARRAMVFLVAQLTMNIPVRFAQVAMKFPMIIPVIAISGRTVIRRRCVIAMTMMAHRETEGLSLGDNRHPGEQRGKQ